MLKLRVSGRQYGDTCQGDGPRMKGKVHQNSEKEENKRIKSTHNRLYKNMYWVNECIINTETEKEGEEEKKS